VNQKHQFKSLCFFHNIVFDQSISDRLCMGKIPVHLDSHTFLERLLDIVLTYSVIMVFVLAAYPLLNEQLLLTVPVKVE
jgi:hypothetical protein